MGRHKREGYGYGCISGGSESSPMAFDGLGAAFDGAGAVEDAKGAKAEGSGSSGGSGGGSEFDNLLTTLLDDLTGQSQSAPNNNPSTAGAAV
jgi:hypothetical protein